MSHTHTPPGDSSQCHTRTHPQETARSVTHAHTHPLPRRQLAVSHAHTHPTSQETARSQRARRGHLCWVVLRLHPPQGWTCRLGGSASAGVELCAHPRVLGTQHRQGGERQVSLATTDPLWGREDDGSPGLAQRRGGAAGGSARGLGRNLRQLGLSHPHPEPAARTSLSWPRPWKVPCLPGPRFPLLESSRWHVL